MTTSSVIEPSLSIVEGRFEGVVNDRVLGWAWSPQSPLERIWVTVFVDEEPIALVAADLERRDLLDAGMGDGAHGFSVQLPIGLCDDGQHTVQVMAGKANTPLSVSPSAMAINGHVTQRPIHNRRLPAEIDRTVPG